MSICGGEHRDVTHVYSLPLVPGGCSSLYTDNDRRKSMYTLHKKTQTCRKKTVCDLPLNSPLVQHTIDMLQIPRRPLSTLSLERSPRRTEVLHTARQANKTLVWIAFERENVVFALLSSGEGRLDEFLRVFPVIIHISSVTF